MRLLQNSVYSKTVIPLKRPSFSLRRLTGALEPAAGGSPVRAAGFRAEPERGGVALCGARELPHPRRGTKGRDTCGLPFLLNSYLPFVSWVWRTETGNRFEKENGRGFFLPQGCCAPMYPHIRSSQTAYCYTYPKVNAEGGTAMPPKGQTNHRAWNALSDAEETLVSVQEYLTAVPLFEAVPPLRFSPDYQFRETGVPKG